MAHGLESGVPFLDNDLADLRDASARTHEAGELDARLFRINENEPGDKVERYYRAYPRRQAGSSANDGQVYPERSDRPEKSRVSQRPTRAGSRAKVLIMYAVD